MWGEHIDQSNLQSVVYPRAAAVGERLWSPAAGDGGVTEEEQEEAEMRLEVQRCRMQERGRILNDTATKIATDSNQILHIFTNTIIPDNMPYVFFLHGVQAFGPARSIQASALQPSCKSLDVALTQSCKWQWQ